LKQILDAQRDDFEKRKLEMEMQKAKEQEEQELLKKLKDEQYKVHAAEIKVKAQQFEDDKKARELLMKAQKEVKVISFKN
jgi:hypothetical protein